MFLQVSVCPQEGEEGRAWLGGVCGWRGGCARLPVGACVVAGGVHGCQGACVVVGGHAWSRGVCVVVGGMHGCGEACMAAGGCAWLPGGHA